MVVCILCGATAGAVVAFFGLRSRTDVRFLVAAGLTAGLAGTLGCIAAGLAAAVGMALALSLVASVPLFAGHRTT